MMESNKKILNFSCLSIKAKIPKIKYDLSTNAKENNSIKTKEKKAILLEPSKILNDINQIVIGRKTDIAPNCLFNVRSKSARLRALGRTKKNMYVKRRYPMRTAIQLDLSSKNSYFLAGKVLNREIHKMLPINTISQE